MRGACLNMDAQARNKSGSETGASKQKDKTESKRMGTGKRRKGFREVEKKEPAVRGREFLDHFLVGQTRRDERARSSRAGVSGPLSRGPEK